jgi:hypothetical protein
VATGDEGMSEEDLYKESVKRVVISWSWSCVDSKRQYNVGSFSLLPLCVPLLFFFPSLFPTPPTRSLASTRRSNLVSHLPLFLLMRITLRSLLSKLFWWRPCVFCVIAKGTTADQIVYQVRFTL